MNWLKSHLRNYCNKAGCFLRVNLGVVTQKETHLEKAVNYAQNHKEQFMTYPEDSRCSFSSNLSLCYLYLFSNKRLIMRALKSYNGAKRSGGTRNARV